MFSSRFRSHEGGPAPLASTFVDTCRVAMYQWQQFTATPPPPRAMCCGTLPCSRVSSGTWARRLAREHVTSGAPPPAGAVPWFSGMRGTPCGRSLWWTARGHSRWLVVWQGRGAALRAPPCVMGPSVPRERVLRILKEDIRNLLDAHPRFHAFFWKHTDEVRGRLVADWQERFDDESLDYSGRSKNLREWVEKLVAAGVFDGDDAHASTAAAKYTKGQKVKVRDAGEPWREGVVHSTSPLRVRPLGDGSEKNWRDALWQEVAPLDFDVGARVRVTDEPSGDFAWRGGIVKALNPLRVKLNGGDGAHEFRRVDHLPDITTITYDTAAKTHAHLCLICRIVAFQDGDRVSTVCGQHIFHEECLQKAFERAPYCPSCRLGEEGSVAAAPAAPSPPTPPANPSVFRPGDVVTVCRAERCGRVLSEPAPTADEVAVRYAGEAASHVHAEAALLGHAAPPAVGMKVEVFGMTEQPALNGMRGPCVGYMKNRVVLDIGGRRRAFRMENLRYYK